MESLVLSLLSKVLGPYFEGISAEKLRVGVWSGNVVLRDLALKHDALNSLELPLKLCSGRVGRLQLRVPWSRLRSEPVELILEDISVAAQIRETPDADAFLRHERLRKRLQLDAEELLCGLRESSTGGETSTTSAAPRGSFLSRLGRAILDNLRLTLIRVNLQCEVPDGGWGAKLERFEMKSTGSTGTPEYQADACDQPWLHKLFVLAGATVYSWQPRSAASAEGAPVRVEASTEELLVLAPTDLELHYRVLRAGARAKPQEPRTSCRCSIQKRIEISLTSRQCVRLMQLSSLLTRLGQRERYERFRKPMLDGKDSVPPLLWWQYAARCILSDLEARRRWRRWASVRMFGAQRREYLALWRSILEDETPTSPLSDRLFELEDALHLDDILLFRALVRCKCTASSHANAFAQPRTLTPSRAVQSMPRSVSDGTLSSSSPSKQRLEATADAASLDMRTPRRAGSPDPQGSAAAVQQTDREQGWLVWLRRGPHLLRRGSHTADGGNGAGHSIYEQAGEDGDDECIGYAPLRVSDSQSQQLRQWMDRAGVLHAEAEELEAAQRAPVQWRFQLQVERIQVELCCEALTFNSAPIHLASVILDASRVQLHQQSDLDGSVSNRADVAFFATHARMRNDADIRHPVLEVPNARRDETSALTVVHRSWPATVGSWLPGSSVLHAGTEAGSEVEITIAPVCIHLLPAVTNDLTNLIGECGALVAAPCGPLLPEPTSKSLLTCSLGSAVLLLNDEKDSVLEFGFTDLSFTSCMPLPDEDEVPAASPLAKRWSSQSELAQSVRARLCVNGAYLRLRSRPAMHMLLKPVMFTLTMSRMVKSGTLQTEILDASASLVSAQLDLVDASTISRVLQLHSILRGAPDPSPEVAAWESHKSGSPICLSRMFNVAIAGMSIDATCCDLVRATLRFDELTITASAQQHGCILEHAEINICTRAVDLDIEHVNLAYASTPHARARGIVCSASWCQSQAAGRIIADCIRIFVMSPGLTQEALMFQLSDAGSDTDEEHGLSASFASDAAMHDINVRLSPCRMVVADVRPCFACLCFMSNACKHVEHQLCSMQGSNSNPVVDKKSHVGKAVALRFELKAFEFEIEADIEPSGPSVTSNALLLQCSFTWLTLLSDRAGNTTLEIQAEALSVASASVGRHAISTLLWPVQIAARYHACSNGERLDGNLRGELSSRERAADIVTVHLGPVRVALSELHRHQILHLCNVVQEASTASISERTAPEASSAAGVAADAIAMRLVQVCFNVSSISIDAVPLLVAVYDLSINYSVHRSATCVCIDIDRFVAQDNVRQTFLIQISRTDQAGERAQAAEQLPSSANMERNQLPAAVHIEVQLMRAGEILVQIACPLVTLRVCPSEMEALPKLDAPAASDIPFAFDLTVGKAEVVLEAGLSGGAANLHAVSALTLHASMAGGVFEPPRAKCLFGFERFSMMLNPVSPTGDTAVIVSPFSGALRLQRGVRRLRGLLKASDLEVQASPDQLGTISLLADALNSWFIRCGTLNTDARWESPSPPNLAMSEASMTSDSVSETSEYFDAREDFDARDALDEPQRTTSPYYSKVILEDIQFEANVGLLTATLLDEFDVGAPGPIVQLTLDISQLHLSQVEHSRVTIGARVSIGMHHYARRFAHFSHRWEPVIASCSLDVSADTQTRHLDVSSCGPVEIDIGTQLIASLLRLQRRMLCTSRGSGHNELALAPFVLRNETGTKMVVWIDAGAGWPDGQPLTEVRPGTVAHLPETPKTLARSGRRVCVMFQGFQQLDLRPSDTPFVRRCRLWSAGNGGSASAIINVLLQGTEHNGIEHYTFLSHFILKNNCTETLQLCLVPKDSSQSLSMVHLEPDAQLPVPLACHGGWLCLAEQASTTSSILQLKDGTAHSLELSPAALDVRSGKGPFRLRSVDPAGKPGPCYQMCVAPMAMPPHGWSITFYERLVLHNALLGYLQYELSECSATRNPSADIISVHHGSLKPGAREPFRTASHCCLLRTSCDGVYWSQQVLIDLRAAAGNTENPYSVVHDLTHALPSGVNEAGKARATHMCLHVAGSGKGIAAEVRGRVWVVNESHVPLQLKILGAGAATIVVDPSPVCASLEDGSVPANASLAAGAVALPTGVGQTLPEVFIREHLSPWQGRPRAATFIALTDLLRCSEHSDDLLLDVHPPEMSSSDRHGGSTVRLLHLGVKLVPLPHLLGSSLLLAISPRLLVLNRTSRPLFCAQRGCSTYATLPAAGASWVALHWDDPQKPRELLLRREDRGSEWSGGIPTGSALKPAGSDGSELMLRLRNLETAKAEFIRLTWHPLMSRAATGLIISDALDLSAPLIIQNHTRHEIQFRQTGVPLVHSVAPAGLMAYAWDEPARKTKLAVRVPALSVAFQCDTTPGLIARPHSLFGRPRAELQVKSEGASTVITVQQTSTCAPKMQQAIPLSSPELPSETSHVGPLRITPRPQPLVGATATWKVQLQMSDIGATLLDNDARELLYLSTRGLRVSISRAAVDGALIDSLSLAIASVQLDCQLPRNAAKEEVLLRTGVAAAGDAVSLQIAVDAHGPILILHCATGKVQNISIRLDEEIIDAVAAALQYVMDDGPRREKTIASPGTSTGTGIGSGTKSWTSAWHHGLDAELHALKNDHEPTRRVFVQHLRLSPVSLKLSLQHASRPDAQIVSANHDRTEDSSVLEVSDAMLRWLRWFGITIIGLDEVPLKMPEVVLHRALLPTEVLLQNVRQQYSRALMQQAYKVLPSAALLGNPYGMLRTVRQGWHKYKQALRHAPWPGVPVVALQGVLELIRTSVASCLHAAGKSAFALSSGLEVLVFEQTQSRLSMPEAILIGVGGLAREASRAIEAMVRRLNERRDTPMTGLTEALVVVGLLPFGFGRALQRLSLLLAVGSLSWMRSSAEACRSLIAPVHADTGRSRLPRAVHSHALYALCAGNFAGARCDEESVVAAQLSQPCGILVLTSRTARCLGHAPGAQPFWEIELIHVLLVQQRGCHVTLVILSAPTDRAGARPTSDLRTYELVLQSDEDAARLHLVLRMASLNARGHSVPPPTRCALLRSTLLTPPSTQHV